MNLCTGHELTKMFLFSRWIIDEYNGILNSKDEEWYKERLLYFEKIVLPKYINEGEYDKTFIFINFVK